MGRLGMGLLAVCRTVYCWAFLVLCLLEIYTIRRSFRGWHILTNLILTIYCVVWGAAWWAIFRSKPTQKRWAIAANIVCMFPFVPAMAFAGYWKDVLKGELSLWPFILVGATGIAVFSIPYRGLRNDSRVAVKCRQTQNE